MKVELEVFSTLKRAIGSRSIELEISHEKRVETLLSMLEDKYGSTFQKETGKRLYNTVVDKFDIFLNNKVLTLPKDLNRKLQNGDKVVILQPSGGG